MEPRATVSSALWLDISDERAAANLRNALWRLGALRKRVITERCSRLGLAAEVSLDLERAVDKARKILEVSGSSDGCCNEEFELELFSRDLLPHWGEDWVLFERERLRQLRIHALESLAERLRRTGRFAEAIEVGLTAVAADPLRETAQRALILATLQRERRRCAPTVSDLSPPPLGGPRCRAPRVARSARWIQFIPGRSTLAPPTSSLHDVAGGRAPRVRGRSEAGVQSQPCR